MEMEINFWQFVGVNGETVCGSELLDHGHGWHSALTCGTPNSRAGKIRIALRVLFVSFGGQSDTLTWVTGK